jgi:hypothetical protein
MKIIRLSFLTAVWLMTAHRLPAPIRSVRKNHSIGEHPSSRYAGFCIPVDQESDIADCDIEGTELMSIGQTSSRFTWKFLLPGATSKTW